jgi:hypothetical protein
MSHLTKFAKGGATALARLVETIVDWSVLKFRSPPWWTWASPVPGNCVVRCTRSSASGPWCSSDYGGPIRRPQRCTDLHGSVGRPPARPTC